MLFFCQRSGISHAIDSKCDGLCFLCRSSSINIVFAELPVLVKIIGNAVSGRDCFISVPFQGRSGINMSCGICIVDVGNAAEANILSGAADDLRTDFLA